MAAPHEGTTEGTTTPVGAQLAAARRERGLSTSDVARRIQLRETVVAAIERDDFSLCGGDVYARGHLRAYARLLGVPPEPLLADYARHHSTSGTPTAHPAPAGAEPATPASGRPAVALPVFRRSGLDDVPLERSGPNWTAAMVVAVAILAVFLGLGALSDMRSPGRQARPVAVDPPAPTASSAPGGPGRTPVPTAPGPIASAPASAPASGVRVVVRATSGSWVSVRTGSGTTVFSGLVQDGATRTFTDDDRLRLTLGNAGGVELTVNGKRLGSPGGDGEVVRVTFGPGDPAAAG